MHQANKVFSFREKHFQLKILIYNKNINSYIETNREGGRRVVDVHKKKHRKKHQPRDQNSVSVAKYQGHQVQQRQSNKFYILEWLTSTLP